MSKRVVDRSEAEMAAAIKSRRDGEGGPWENALLTAMAIVPLIAFAVWMLSGLGLM